jgi:hypothetical protein
MDRDGVTKLRGSGCALPAWLRTRVSRHVQVVQRQARPQQLVLPVPARDWNNTVIRPPSAPPRFEPETTPFAELVVKFGGMLFRPKNIDNWLACARNLGALPSIPSTLFFLHSDDGGLYLFATCCSWSYPLRRTPANIELLSGLEPVPTTPGERNGVDCVLLFAPGDEVELYGSAINSLYSVHSITRRSGDDRWLILIQADATQKPIGFYQSDLRLITPACSTSGPAPQLGDHCLVRRGSLANEVGIVSHVDSFGVVFLQFAHLPKVALAFQRRILRVVPPTIYSQTDATLRLLPRRL